jgi:hypothetical protein
MTPWQVATLHTQLAMLEFNAGRHEEGARNARIAVPLLERLHAAADATSMRISLALAAVHAGDLDEAQRVLDEVGEPESNDITGLLVAHQVEAELLLARGEVAEALSVWCDVVDRMRKVRFPGVETNEFGPWVLVSLGTALTAHVRYAETPAQRKTTRDLAGQTVATIEALMRGPEAALDYPVSGGGLAGLGAWQLTVDGGDHEAGVRLLALALAFGYNRWFPVMAWEPLATYAEAAAPGRLSSVTQEYDGRRGRDLRDEVSRVLALVTSSE